MIPPKISLEGNEFRAMSMLGMGREFLRQLKERMEYRGLTQDQRTIRYDDGRIIHVQRRFGESHITIFWPEYLIIEEEEEEEEEEEGEPGRFFVKISSNNGDDTYYWVIFEKIPDNEEELSVKVESVGQRMDGEDALPEDIKEIEEHNYGGKSFDVSYEDGEGNQRHFRFIGYTGEKPFLFRDGKEVYQGEPENEEAGYHSGISIGSSFIANFHKFHILNKDNEGQYVAWYYYRQVPNFTLAGTSLRDLRQTRAKVDVCKILFNEDCDVMPSPRMDCRGGIGHAADESWLTAHTKDEAGDSFFRKHLYTSNEARINRAKQFQQGAHAGLDLVKCKNFGSSVEVTMYQNYRNGLGLVTYRLPTETELDDPDRPGTWPDNMCLFVKTDIVPTGESLYWTNEGSTSVKTLDYYFEVFAHRKYPVHFSRKVDEDPQNPRTYWRSRGWGSCSSMNCFSWQTEWQNTTGKYRPMHVHPDSKYWYSFGARSGLIITLGGTGGRIAICKKGLDFNPEFWGKLSSVHYRAGEMANTARYTNDQKGLEGTLTEVWSYGRIYDPETDTWSFPNMSLLPDATFCGIEQGSPMVINRFARHVRSGYVRAKTHEAHDINDFQFDWDDMYKDEEDTGCKIFHPNIIQQKGRHIRSLDSSRASYFRCETLLSPGEQTRSTSMTSIYWRRGYIEDAGRHLSYSAGGPLPSTGQAEEVMLMDKDFSLPLQDSGWSMNSRVESGAQITVGNKMGGGSQFHDYEQYDLFLTDGYGSISDLPNDCEKYYYMDDRSTDDTQGVFMMTKCGSKRRFFHFWKNGETFKEVTDQVLEGLGIETEKEQEKIELIGLA